MSCIKSKILFLKQGGRYRNTADKFDYRFIDRKPGIWVNYFIAGIHKGMNCVVNNRFSPRRDNYFIWRNRNPARFTNIMGNSLPQRQDAGRGAIMSVVLLNGFNASRLNILRGVKIGLTNGKTQNVAAIGL
ncbi:hypothetical protein SDC9_125725 [bioreactor metagenome]|uniref:Uncharacterized protein n=1 Tax=bioreactor metagenome TaxID=1076179 RepID=A0A645CPB1_9ZZZZ